MSFMFLTKLHSPFKFVVMLQSYEYDDESYTAESGGEPVTVYDDNAAAQEEANARAITWLQTTSAALGEYLWSRGLEDEQVAAVNDVFNRNWTEDEWLEWSPYGMSAWGAEHLLSIVDTVTPYYVLPIPYEKAA